MMGLLNYFQKQKVNMFRLLNGLKNFMLTWLFLFPHIGMALSTDNELPMQIVADSSLINYKTGIYTYEGNVKVTQGSTVLTADRLITKSNTKHKIEEATAYGLNQLAEYSTIPKQGDKLLHAKAKIIRFLPPKSTIELENDVTVTQGENSFHGSFITYNIKDQIVTAPSSRIGRATIIIEPEQLKS